MLPCTIYYYVKQLILVEVNSESTGESLNIKMPKILFFFNHMQATYSKH